MGELALPESGRNADGRAFRQASRRQGGGFPVWNIRLVGLDVLL